MPSSGDFIGWLLCSFGRRSRVRVELYLDTEEVERNKTYFDRLISERSAIEAKFGEPLEWDRLEGRRASKIVTYHDGAITVSPQERSALAQWAAGAIERLHSALVEPVAKLAKQR